jgi:hypothetical protein
MDRTDLGLLIAALGASSQPGLSCSLLLPLLLGYLIGRSARNR